MEFKQIIKMYLDCMSAQDAEFAKAYASEQKSLDECVLFIQSQMYQRAKESAKKNNASSACVIPTDDEVFALAVRYYNDADLKVDGSAFDNVKVLSLSATSFTDEEKDKMRQEAIQKYHEDVIEEQKRKAREQAEKKKGKTAKPATPVLVPDVPATKQEEGKTSTEDKPKKAMELNLFDL